MSTAIKKSDFIQSLEKGLKVIAVFDRDHPELTLTQVAKAVDLTRANARRILLTLEYLGYVSCADGKLFKLTPKVLCLGYSYLSSLSFQELAQPYMEDLADIVNESCSMSVLEGKDIVYVARVQTKRIMTIALGIGTRLPVHATSMGRVLIAGMAPGEMEKYIEELDFEAFTPYTLVDKLKFTERVHLVKARSWALSDQELEIGIRSIAHALRDKNGKILAAINISGHASRVSKEEMIERFLPALKETVSKIENALHQL